MGSESKFFIIDSHYLCINVHTECKCHVIDLKSQGDIHTNDFYLWPWIIMHKSKLAGKILSCNFSFR